MENPGLKKGRTFVNLGSLLFTDWCRKSVQGGLASFGRQDGAIPGATGRFRASRLKKQPRPAEGDETTQHKTAKARPRGEAPSIGRGDKLECRETFSRKNVTQVKWFPMAR